LFFFCGVVRFGVRFFWSKGESFKKETLSPLLSLRVQAVYVFHQPQIQHKPLKVERKPPAKPSPLVREPLSYPEASKRPSRTFSREAIFVMENEKRTVEVQIRKLKPDKRSELPPIKVKKPAPDPKDFLQPSKITTITIKEYDLKEPSLSSPPPVNKKGTVRSASQIKVLQKKGLIKKKEKLEHIFGSFIDPTVLKSQANALASASSGDSHSRLPSPEAHDPKKIQVNSKKKLRKLLGATQIVRSFP
jgi:hypothetical protein